MLWHKADHRNVQISAALKKRLQPHLESNWLRQRDVDRICQDLGEDAELVRAARLYLKSVKDTKGSDIEAVDIEESETGEVMPKRKKKRSS